MSYLVSQKASSTPVEGEGAFIFAAPATETNYKKTGRLTLKHYAVRQSDPNRTEIWWIQEVAGREYCLGWML
jgi:hypothetical protein